MRNYTSSSLRAQEFRQDKPGEGEGGTIAQINGTGVRLRAFRADDAEALAIGLDDPITQRFLPSLSTPFTLAHAERYIAERVAATYAEGGTLYAIADPETDELLGGIGFDKVVPARRQAEVGYWVGPWARGRGVATAALRSLSRHALAHGLERLELLAHWENPLSHRVALNAGYTREGVRRGAEPGRGGERDDMVVFTRLAADSGDPPPRLLPDLPGGELTDGVVRLRPLGPGDVDFLTELRALPDVINTSVPPIAPTREQNRRRCAWAEAQWLAGTRADLVIEDVADGRPAGDIGLFYDEPFTQQAMIGYSMLPAYRGRGFPTRAAQLLSLWVFAETGVVRLIAGAHPDNLASQRVLTKAGFHQEAYLRKRLPGPDGTRTDDVQFVLLAEDLLN